MDRINEIFQENFKKQRQKEMQKILEERTNEEIQKRINEETQRKFDEEMQKKFEKETIKKLERDLIFSYFETDFMDSDVFKRRIKEIKAAAFNKLRWAGGFTYEDFENVAKSELSGETEKVLIRVYIEKALKELIDENEIFQIGENRYIIKVMFEKVHSTMMVFNELDETTKSEILGKILVDAL